MPEWMRGEIDNRRETDQAADDFETISEYVQEALMARFRSEDAGEWTTPEVEQPNAPTPE